MNTIGEPTDQPRKVFLDGLRLLAAFWVFLFHFAKNSVPETVGLLKTLSDTGAWGVSFFFVLSGFVLTKTYGHTLKGNVNSRQVLAFLAVRWLRLAPVYYSVLILFLLLYGLILSEPVPVEELLLHLTMTQAWFQDKALSLNFPAWSISCEIFYYSLFPLLNFTFIFLQRKLKSLLLFLSIIVVPAWAATGMPQRWGLYHPLSNLPLFLCGMMLALSRFEVKLFTTGVLLWLSGLLIIPEQQKCIIFMNGYAAAPVFAGLIFAASRISLRSARLVQILLHAGLWSYPFYLGQYFSALLTKYLYWQFLTDILMGFDWRHVFWVNVLMAAGLSYVVEKPFEKIRKSVKKRLFISEL